MTLIRSQSLASTIDLDSASTDPSCEGVAPADATRSLVFRVGGRVYACNATHVREVVPLESVTRLPGVPATVLGLVNVRGTIITVVDGGALLSQRPTPRRGAVVLLVDIGPRGVGLAVDGVADVRAVRTDEDYQQLDVRALLTRVVTITEE